MGVELFTLLVAIAILVVQFLGKVIKPPEPWASLVPMAVTKLTEYLEQIKLQHIAAQAVMDAKDYQENQGQTPDGKWNFTGVDCLNRAVSTVVAQNYDNATAERAVRAAYQAHFGALPTSEVVFG